MKEVSHPNAFYIIFCKSSITTTPMLFSAPTPHDKKEWISALRNHQIDVISSRATFFERKLERLGMRVPRASILVTKGFNAPLQNIKAPRTMSAQPGELQSLLTQKEESKSQVTTSDDQPGLRKFKGSAQQMIQHSATMMPIREEQEEL